MNKLEHDEVVQLRYVVHTKGVEPLGTFARERDAEAFVKYLKEEDDWNMPLVIEDQQELIKRDYELTRRTRNLRDALRELLAEEEASHTFRLPVPR